MRLNGKNVHPALLITLGQGRLQDFSQGGARFFLGAPNVIINAGYTFLPFNLISPPYTTSYHFSSYLAHFLSGTSFR